MNLIRPNGMDFTEFVILRNIVSAIIQFRQSNIPGNSLTFFCQYQKIYFPINQNHAFFDIKQFQFHLREGKVPSAVTAVSSRLTITYSVHFHLELFSFLTSQSIVLGTHPIFRVNTSFIMAEFIQDTIKKSLEEQSIVWSSKIYLAKAIQYGGLAWASIMENDLSVRLGELILKNFAAHEDTLGERNMAVQIVQKIIAVFGPEQCKSFAGLFLEHRKILTENDCHFFIQAFPEVSKIATWYGNSCFEWARELTINDTMVNSY